ncbi:ZP domain-containing protein-like [Dendronephthya gigantea]|uniref:ZP domain-containing protein-like n=1 Tax=Dendronephthya gigantea TaxID=151771 RepID=UPI001069C292|nr:ZP domain-containing protein-like [Dendronephthya gigantea]
MSYANSANIHIRFSTYFSDKSQFDNAVDRIRYTGGGTATSMALNMAYNSMFTTGYGARGPGFKKVLVILTDGYSNGQVSGPALKLKNYGVVIFSVGIGHRLSMQELREMASDPVDQHVIILDNFSQLESLAKKMSGQTCNASHFQVFCDKDYMTAVFHRSDLPKNVNVGRLYLQYRSYYCKASYNSTHVIVKTQLTGCGTVVTKDDQTLYFSNSLSEVEQSYSGSGVITRNYLFRANMTCSFPRKRTVGSFSFDPAKERTLVVLSGKGNFSLSMDVFRSRNYRDSYTSQDYPVVKSLSDNLYIQYYLNTSNYDLVVRAETCRATPTNRPYDTPQYVFIDDGCDKDETIRHYTYGMSSVQRFSIQAFRFLSQHRFVYLHCDLVVCYRYDSNSTCSRSTSCPRRVRRAAVDEPSDDASKKYALSFGPLMYGKESTDKNSGGKSGASSALFGSLVGVGCLSLILIGALVIVIKRPRRHRSTVQPQTGVENKDDAMALPNLGYT